jgi:hypothetical protein
MVEVPSFLNCLDLSHQGLIVGRARESIGLLRCDCEVNTPASHLAPLPLMSGKRLSVIVDRPAEGGTVGNIPIGVALNNSGKFVMHGRPPFILHEDAR